MLRPIRFLLAATALVAPFPALVAQSTEVVDVSTGGVQGDGSCGVSSISADGRFVDFVSIATNLVPGDTNARADVFVHDRLTGETQRVSLGPAGAQADDWSDDPAISADGRFVAFESAAANLLATPDANHFRDVFVHDRVSGTTELISLSTAAVQGNEASFDPSISADGRYVAFHSFATNLVAAPDANGFSGDVFVRDRQSGTTEMASVSSAGIQGNGGSFTPSISGDGRHVAFYSHATNLMAAPDANGTADVFVRDRLTGTTELASLSSGGIQGNDTSWNPAISADGKCVAFNSLATNLAPVADTNGRTDIFVRDRAAGRTEMDRVSSPPASLQGNDSSEEPSLSFDGRYVVFDGESTNLDADGDANGSLLDVFVRDRLTGITEIVSLGSSGHQGYGESLQAALSADGRIVVFLSSVTDLLAGPDANGSLFDVFARDRGAPPIVSSCFGDGIIEDCPCSNNGQSGRGCENSSTTGGAQLNAAGSPSLSADTLVLTASGERPAALSLFLQGSVSIFPVAYGDGRRCVAGTLKRLYVKNAVAGVVTAPQPGDPSVSARSAALSAAIPVGATRHYQTYYRDPDLSFCPSPPGDSWNITQALSAVWSP